MDREAYYRRQMENAYEVAAVHQKIADAWMVMAESLDSKHPLYDTLITAALHERDQAVSFNRHAAAFRAEYLEESLFIRENCRDSNGKT